MTTHTHTEAQTAIESGTEMFVPLNKLKKSPKNARKTPHGEAAIEALAASIAAKGMLQNLVVEPERNADGVETGFYFVTIGELPRPDLRQPGRGGGRREPRPDLVAPQRRLIGTS